MNRLFLQLFATVQCHAGEVRKHHILTERFGRVCIRKMVFLVHAGEARKRRILAERFGRVCIRKTVFLVHPKTPHPSGTIW